MENGPRPLPDEDPATGEPVRELAGLREAPDPAFPRRIRNSIQRRQLASHGVDFSLMAFFEAIMDYLGLFLGALGAPGSGKGKPR